MPAFRFAFALGGLLAVVGVSAAATPKEIEAAVQKGTESLKLQYQNATPAQIAEGPDGIGPAALAGLALLEVGVAADDAAVKAITAAVRDGAFGEVRTYQITLCILFLDRLGDPADEPVIQLLAVRLLAGQNARGGWTYACTDPVPAADEARLRASLGDAELKTDGKNPPRAGNPGKAAAPAKPTATGKLHPEVQKYAAKLATGQRRGPVDDNSNTQFGILGVWVARRHGVSAEGALDLIEKRFLATQTAAGGWPYTDTTPGTPSMTCAGLLGLATAVARREERQLKATATRKPEPTPDGPAKPADPKANTGRKRPADARDAAIQKAFASLAAVLAGNPAPGGGKGKGNAGGLLAGNALGDRDYYFLWSLERVGVIFETDKIGNIDWYAVGADALVATQHPTGGWGRPPRGTMVETSFALLFLSRSNLARELTAKVQNAGLTAELRAGSPPAAPGGDRGAKASATPVPTAVAPLPKALTVSRGTPVVVTPSTPVPSAGEPEGTTLAAELIDATGTNWDKALAKLRDSRGGGHTQALVIAAGRLDGEKRKAVREALAERLTRMTADTLRAMAKAEASELRRGAVLAMAMKDEKEFVLDLIVALSDEADAVVRAAHAGLKSLTGEDFGPPADATAAERAAAIRAWGEWLKKQKQ